MRSKVKDESSRVYTIVLLLLSCVINTTEDEKMKEIEIKFDVTYQCTVLRYDKVGKKVHASGGIGFFEELLITRTQQRHIPYPTDIIITIVFDGTE